MISFSPRTAIFRELATQVAGLQDSQKENQSHLKHFLKHCHSDLALILVEVVTK